MAHTNHKSHRPKWHAVMGQNQRWEYADVVVVAAREREFMKLLAKGLETNEIARRMRISPRTVQSYGFNMSYKFGVAGLRQLIVIAVNLNKTPRSEPRGATVCKTVMS